MCLFFLNSFLLIAINVMHVSCLYSIQFDYSVKFNFHFSSHTRQTVQFRNQPRSYGVNIAGSATPFDGSTYSRRHVERVQYATAAAIRRRMRVDALSPGNHCKSPM